MKEEERKAAAREALVEAINQRDVPTLLGIHGWDTGIPLRAALMRLEAALREGANSGLAGEEMVAAKAALKQRYFGVEVESMSKDAVHFDTQKTALRTCVVWSSISVVPCARMLYLWCSAWLRPAMISSLR